jgi:hypothetical protein
MASVLLVLHQIPVYISLLSHGATCHAHLLIVFSIVGTSILLSSLLKKFRLCVSNKVRNQYCVHRGTLETRDFCIFHALRFHVKDEKTIFFLLKFSSTP